MSYVYLELQVLGYKWASVSKRDKRLILHKRKPKSFYKGWYSSGMRVAIADPRLLKRLRASLVCLESKSDGFTLETKVLRFRVDIPSGTTRMSIDICGNWQLNNEIWGACAFSGCKPEPGEYEPYSTIKLKWRGYDS